MLIKPEQKNEYYNDSVHRISFRKWKLICSGRKAGWWLSRMGEQSGEEGVLRPQEDSRGQELSDVNLIALRTDLHASRAHQIV